MRPFDLIKKIIRILLYYIYIPLPDELSYSHSFDLTASDPSDSFDMRLLDRTHSATSFANVNLSSSGSACTLLFC